MSNRYLIGTIPLKRGAAYVLFRYQYTQAIAICFTPSLSDSDEPQELIDKMRGTNFDDEGVFQHLVSLMPNGEFQNVSDCSPRANQSFFGKRHIKFLAWLEENDCMSLFLVKHGLTAYQPALENAKRAIIHIQLCRFLKKIINLFPTEEVATLLEEKLSNEARKQLDGIFGLRYGELEKWFARAKKIQ